MKKTCSYHQFAFHANVNPESGARMAARIDAGFNPPNDSGERYYKSAGFCFDIGRKPFLIEQDGLIYRMWALNKKELREKCRVSRRAAIVADPFALAGE